MLAPCVIPVLIVDDRPENLTALEALLSDMPFELDLVKASSGNAALRESLRRDFALILLDVQMPDMDGLETAALLRSYPKTEHLPIIFVTAGMNEPAHLFKGYESGAVDYMIKPIEPLVLRSKVRVFCELYAQRQEIEFRKGNLEAMVEQRTAALRESEARMRCLLESAYEAFVGIDAAGIVFEWNGQAECLFGWTREQAMGRPVVELVLPQRYRASAQGKLAHYLPGAEGGANARRELNAAHRDGSVFPVELSIWPIPSAGQCLFGAFIRDITERKRAILELRLLNESLESRVQDRTHALRLAMDQIVESEKLASLGGIVAGVAHELSTPIGNVVLTASVLEDKIEALARGEHDGVLSRSLLQNSIGEFREANAVIGRSAARAARLIDSFKQVAVDQTSQRRRSFALHETVADILRTIGTTMRHAKVTSAVQIAAEITMDSYPGDLEQILNNLIMNSIHHGFAERGHGHICIAASACADMVEIVYRDDGAGIAPALHHKVFEPFYTTKLGQGGSGLGMFIVHNLVHGSLKGEIRLDSEPGKGVVFTMALPARTPQPPAPEP
jgi:PAS domain S-box-containing protein